MVLDHVLDLEGSRLYDLRGMAESDYRGAGFEVGSSVSSIVAGPIADEVVDIGGDIVDREARDLGEI